MKYYSTNKQSPLIDFKAATIQGQAPDKGLYFPEYIPQVSEELIKNIEQYSNEAIAYEVIKPYVGDCIPENDLKKIVEETINFSIPLISINEQIASLELFHGPTLAFKDVGARFMSRCLAIYEPMPWLFCKRSKQKSNRAGCYQRRYRRCRCQWFL